LDRLRDRAALGAFERVLLTAPDRLARNYVHQMGLLEELTQHGCQVEFLDRPMSDAPHDQLLLQIRGAVAEYERTLIADRMRRGRQAKIRSGLLLPWTVPPYGYLLDPECPRDPSRLRLDPVKAAVVTQIFAWDTEPQRPSTLYGVTKRLSDAQLPTPTGKPRWNTSSVRGILRNPVYTGMAHSGKSRPVPARQRKSALRPVGPGLSHRPTRPEDWVPIPVPALISAETFDAAQARLEHNSRTARRNNTTFYVAAVVKPPCVFLLPCIFGRCVTSPRPVWRLPVALGPIRLQRPSIRAGSHTRHPILYTSCDESRKARRRRPHLCTGVFAKPGRSIRAASTSTTAQGVTQHLHTAYAALSSAPSGKTPVLRKRHSAMSNFRATATMPLRLRRLPPPPKRSRNQQRRALSGW
jgi:DNA invertase Pin-like site-specific DNA recombinase